jgi:hypothetical protein
MVDGDVVFGPQLRVTRDCDQRLAKWAEHPKDLCRCRCVVDDMFQDVEGDDEIERCITHRN